MRSTIARPLGSPAYARHAKTVAGLTFRDLRTFIRPSDVLRGWPQGLYIPAAAKAIDYWPLSLAPVPASNRYGVDWTNASAGWGVANKADGSLFAVASAPTAKGAIDGTVEAGVGFFFTPKSTLSRVRIEPDLSFTGRHEWGVDVDPVVRVRTQVSGTIFVGGFLWNPATRSYEPIPNFTWHRHAVFSQVNQGAGASALSTIPFSIPGAAAGADVLVQSGRTYLLAVVAQVALRVTTENAAGRHVDVSNGTFNTWGSLAGKVPQIWLVETVYVP